MEDRGDEEWETLQSELIDQAIRVLIPHPDGQPIPPEEIGFALGSLEAILYDIEPLAKPPTWRIVDLHSLLREGSEAATKLQEVMARLAEFHYDYGVEFSKRHEDLRRLGVIFDESQMAGARHTENESPTYAAVKAVELYCTLVQAHLPQDQSGKRKVHSFIMGSPMGQFVTSLSTPFLLFNAPAEMTGTTNGRFHRFCEILLEVVAGRELTDTERDRLLSQIQFSVDRLRRGHEAREDGGLWDYNRRHDEDPVFSDRNSEEADRLFSEARQSRPRRQPSKQ